MLELSGVSSFYGELKVLEDISIKVEDGEFVTLFGPNGHGKSTLLKTICGLHRSASGTIKLNGEEIAGLAPSKIVERGIVYIAEARNLFPYMSVLENLKLGAYNINAWHEINQNLTYVYQLFPQLKELSKRQAGTLSGGEARMLAIGRGLMSNAKFLAVDEPSLGLAPYLRTEVFEKINQINKDGSTILLVEQNIAEILDMVGKVYLIEYGRIVFEGQKENILKDARMRELYLGT